MPGKYNLPPQVAEAMEGYFRLRIAGVGRGYFADEAYRTLDDFLRDCHFVFVANGGSVLHTERYCGRTYSKGPVPFDLAYEKGYRTACPKCAKGSYIERLLKDRITNE